jgi:hypothetical protein
MSSGSPHLPPVYVSIRQHTSAYVSIRQHTSAYVSIRQHTPAYVSSGSPQRQQTGKFCMRQQDTPKTVRLMPAGTNGSNPSYLKRLQPVVSQTAGHCRHQQVGPPRAEARRWIRARFVACLGVRGVSMRQHTSAYVSIRQHTSACLGVRGGHLVFQRLRQHTSYFSADLLTGMQIESAYVSIRQHSARTC